MTCKKWFLTIFKHCGKKSDRNLFLSQCGSQQSFVTCFLNDISENKRNSLQMPLDYSPMNFSPLFSPKRFLAQWNKKWHGLKGRKSKIHVFQTLRMGSNMLAVNPTWSTGSFDEIRNSTATKNLLQMSSSATSNGPLGIHTSVSMVSSNKNSTTAGWPMRLL